MEEIMTQNSLDKAGLDAAIKAIEDIPVAIPIGQVYRVGKQANKVAQAAIAAYLGEQKQ